MTAVEITAAEAAALVLDGSTVGLDGFTMMGVADEIYAAVAHSFATTGSPQGLTVVHPAGQSNREQGIERFAVPGLLRRVVGPHWGLAPRLGRLINDNGVEGICLPQGQLAGLLRAIAAGRPGNLSRVGLGTFVDPRVEGGRVNASAQAAADPEEYVRLLDLDGEEMLLYRSFPIDVAIIRGSRMDKIGNLAQDDEAAGLDALALAQAVRNSGGTVIVQVAERVADGVIAPRAVTVPANLIDYVVVATDPAVHHRVTDTVGLAAELVGGVLSDDAITAMVAERQVAEHRMRIGRRGAALVRPGDVVNVGTGIPGDTVGRALAETGMLAGVTISIESGVSGGVPLGGSDFGAALHPRSIVPHAAQFDFYTGGGVDIAFMGAGQVSRRGEVNVSRLGGRLIGCGGFIDILSGARRICFLMSTSGANEKFVDEVDHLTFSGSSALLDGREVSLATESSLFMLTQNGWQIVHDDGDELAEQTAQRLGATRPRVEVPAS
mgnify:FL=1